MVVGSIPTSATKVAEGMGGKIQVRGLGDINKDMNWHLFLDDERLPATTDDRVFIARDFDSAVALVLSRTYCQCPTFISFDHDLGPDSLTGYDFAKWLVEKDLDKDGEFIPKDFYFCVHSQNPVGKENIEKYLEGYLNARHKTHP